MNVMMNLFSVFDPSSSFGLGLNWLSLFLGLLIFPLLKWSVQTLVINLISFIFEKLNMEIKLILSVKSKITPVIFISLFFFILFNNLMGLIPYIFTATSHLAVTLSLALPLWLGYFSYGWVMNMKWMLAHLVPQGTPSALMPFMVLIESVSSLIRPLTLSVRLMANMIAGHLLLTLVSGAIQVFSLSAILLIVLSQVLLVILEVAVAAIQSYVLVVLSILYTSEV